MVGIVYPSRHPTGCGRTTDRHHCLFLRSVRGRPPQERGSFDRPPSPMAEGSCGRPHGEGLADRPQPQAGPGTAMAALALGGTGPSRVGLGSRGVEVARASGRPGAVPLFRIECEAWQESSREDAEQTTHPATQLVCSGDLQVVPSGLLEGLVGELASTADFLLPLATCPQGASSGELVVVDRSGGALLDLS